MQSCTLDEFMQAVKKSNVCIKGILQTPTSSGKGELESVNMAMRFVLLLLKLHVLASVCGRLAKLHSKY